MKHGRKLVVEGVDDLHAIAELMGHHTDWPNEKSSAPVKIISRGGYTEILESEYIETEYNASDTSILRIVLDADTEYDARWSALKREIAKVFPGVPEVLDPNGLILRGSDGKSLGAWIMPDNVNHGMIETFLQSLVRVDDAALLQHAETSATGARELGAPFSDAHFDKAKIHTWLAWQDPPGQALGRAITTKALDPNSPAAASFVGWFMDLYQLPPLP